MRRGNAPMNAHLMGARASRSTAAWRLTVLTALVGVLPTGCRPPPATPAALSAAHTALLRAQLGPAREQAPAHVARAEVGFAAARAACARDPGSTSCRDLSYVAMRRAEQAELEANVSLAHRAHHRAHLALAARRAQVGANRAPGQSEAAVPAAPAQAPADPVLAHATKELRAAAAEGDQVWHEPGRGIVVRVGSAKSFADGSSQLLAETRAQLAQLAAALRRTGPGRLQVTTAAEPNESHDLARARTQAVMAHLMACGVPATQLRSAPSWADGGELRRQGGASAAGLVELTWQPAARTVD